MTTNAGLARLVGQERIDYLARLANDPNNLSDRVRLRLWRIAKGLNTGQVADRIGKHRSSVNQIEVGYGRAGGNIQRSSLMGYLRALGLSLDEFYAGPLVTPTINVANRITLWRMLAGVSSAELAELTGLPIHRVNKWYSQRTSPKGEDVSPEDVLLVCKTLGVPFDVLTQGLKSGAKALPKDPVPLFRRVDKMQGFRTHPENISHNLRAKKKASREAATSTPSTVTGNGAATASGPRRGMTDNALAEVLAVAIVRALDEYTKATLAAEAPAGVDDVRIAAEPTRPNSA